MSEMFHELLSAEGGEEHEADEGHPQLNQDHRALFAWINAPSVKWWEQVSENICEANPPVYKAQRRGHVSMTLNEVTTMSLLPLHPYRRMCFLLICSSFHQLASLLLCSRRKCAFSKEPNALEMPSPPPNPANLNATLNPASGFQYLSPYFHTNIGFSHC